MPVNLMFIDHYPGMNKDVRTTRTMTDAALYSVCDLVVKTEKFYLVYSPALKSKNISKRFISYFLAENNSLRLNYSLFLF